MRIAALWIRNNPFLGNLELDFRGSDGRALRHVIIAGENGCGKTAVLEIIHAILGNTGTHWSAAPTQAYAFIEGHVPEKPPDQRYPDPQGELRSITREFRDANPQFQGLVLQLAGQHATLPAVETYPLQKQQLLGTALPSFYSDARVAFDVGDVERPAPLAEEYPETFPGQRIASVATISSQNLGNELVQLLVNLKVADDEDTARWVREHRGRGQEVPDEIFERRIGRFRDAFAGMMPHKRFHDVIRVNGRYQVVFQERGNSVPLGRLSTGEKQVVLRGGFLLRNFEHLPGAVVLVDEPELGLHPSWQERILDYYDQIAREDPERPGQVIIATHSPFVVHGSPAAKHVVLRRENQTERIEVDRSFVYPGVTPEAVAIAAFDLSSSVFARPGNRMVVVTEGRTDAEILRTAWMHLRPGQTMPFNLMSAGGAKSVRAFLGAEADTMGPLMDALGDARIDRFLALFDFDREGYEQWNGMITAPRAEAEDLTVACAHRKRRGAPVWAALLPVPSFRPSYAGFGPGLESRSRLTIELLFEDAHVRPLLVEEPVPGVPGAAVLVAPDSRKAAIAAATASFPPSAFAAFEPIFQLIEMILGAP